ncbi:MAG TPA: hypothetical protein PKD00_00520 [Burkholderiales bacterium]|nr:hypothetical protein [Burkholderiales bacterium]
MRKHSLNREFSSLPSLIIAIFGFIIGVILISVSISIWSQSKVSVITDCKVITLQQQQKINGSSDKISTEYRYLVITDKGTFVCENSLYHNKYNNSELFFNLKEGEIYTFKVAGIGKTLVTDYKNILQVTKE